MGDFAPVPALQGEHRRDGIEAILPKSVKIAEGSLDCQRVGLKQLEPALGAAWASCSLENVKGDLG